MTTSTLAGEYVTARDYVGGRARGGKFWDEYFLYKERAKAELCWAMYVLSKMGRLTMELGVVMTRQNFGFPCSHSCSCCLCQGKGGGRHERGAAKRG